jgi:hypothetical protein
MCYSKLALAFALTVSACADQSPAPGAPQPQPQPFQAGITLSDSQGRLAANIASKNFNFGALPVLWVRTSVEKMSNPSTVSLEFLNPKGEVAYEHSSPFSNDPNFNSMPMPGMDHDQTVFQAQPLAGGWGLDVPIPVIGSAIARFPTVCTGTWMLRSRVDGANADFSTTFDVVFER